MEICLVNCILLARFHEASLEYGVGGAQTYLICLSESSASVGYDVAVVCQYKFEHVIRGVKRIPIEHVFMKMRIEAFLYVRHFILKLLSSMHALSLWSAYVYVYWIMIFW